MTHTTVTIIDTVMAYFDEYAVFDHATGPDINGTRFTGSKNIRKVFQSLFENVESVSWNAVDPESLVTRLTVNFILLQNLNPEKYRTF